MPLFYADSSALVKLFVREPESEALRLYLADADLVSSELVLTEIPRALRRVAARDRSLAVDHLLGYAEEVIASLALAPVDRGLLAGAGALAEASLRTLDAIHVATAVSLGSVEAFVSYDERQSAATRLAGLRTIAPG